MRRRIYNLIRFWVKSQKISYPAKSFHVYQEIGHLSTNSTRNVQICDENLAKRDLVPAGYCQHIPSFCQDRAYVGEMTETSFH